MWSSHERVGWACLTVAIACAPQTSGAALGALDRADRVSLAQAVRVIQVLPTEVVAVEHVAQEDVGTPIVAPPPFTEGIFPCSRCHSTEGVREEDGPFFEHQMHWDAGMDCVTCHGEPASRARPEICFQCHPVGTVDVRPAVADYFEAHRGDADELVIPHRWETADVDPDHAGHLAIDISCTQCHGEEPFKRPQPVALMTKCVNCHQRLAAKNDCSTCHTEIRENQHSEIELHHGEGIGGCYDCHDVADRDSLRLASGTTVPFAESYRLCGQCHGTRLRDWRVGLHGKRVGRWDGDHQYLLCVHCHNDPHNPGFPKMEPYAAPPRPEAIR